MTQESRRHRRDMSFAVDAGGSGMDKKGMRLPHLSHKYQCICLFQVRLVEGIRCKYLASVLSAIQIGLPRNIAVS